MNSGFESNGYGLINLDGTLTPRARAAGKVAQEIARNGGDLLATEPAGAQVAVLFNRLSYMVGGSESSLSKLGNATRDSLEGVHRAFFEQQIPVDFVHPMDVVHDKLGPVQDSVFAFPGDALEEVLPKECCVTSKTAVPWWRKRAWRGTTSADFPAMRCRAWASQRYSARARK